MTDIKWAEVRMSRVIKMNKLWELAENKIKYATPRQKTINIKIAINTARMMVESEKKFYENPELLKAGNNA